MKMIRITSTEFVHKLLVVSIFLFGIFGILASGGGGGGGDDGDDSGGSATDTMTINMSPLRVVGYSDDYQTSLYPIVRLDTPTISMGTALLIRVRDPYGMGDYYSVTVADGGGGPGSASPMADDGEPDNSPIEASALPWNTIAHRGLNPLLDEDWFSHTTVQDCCITFTTKQNLSGSGADPVLEVYDATPNLGPVTYSENDSDINFVTTVAGVFDSNNGLTGIGMIREFGAGANLIDSNEFFLVFSGPTTPGDYPIQFAFPPDPADLPGSVTGSIHIDQYDSEGGRIIGSFDLTIVDDSRTTTVAGSFDVTREPDEPGLFSRPVSSRTIAPSIFVKHKSVTAYMRRD